MMLKAWLKPEHSFRFLLSGLLLALWLCLQSSQAAIARMTSTIAGAVFDARLPLAAARLDVCDNSRHIQRTAATEVRGSYWIPALPDGSHRMLISPKQFKINERIRVSSLFRFFNLLEGHTPLR
jgi:hypothetical protein